MIWRVVFLSTLSLRRATAKAEAAAKTAEFLSTLSLRRATPPSLIFLYPAFLSTLSLRRATAPAATVWRICCDFYPRSPCGERRSRWCCSGRCRRISIHALLAESDSSDNDFQTGQAVISIHALLAESDPPPRPLRTGAVVFLSTLSLRRATRNWIVMATSPANFYPRSPCGERPLFNF